MKDFAQEIRPRLAVVREVVKQEGLYDPQSVQPISHLRCDDSSNEYVDAAGRSLLEALLYGSQPLARPRGVLSRL